MFRTTTLNFDKLLDKATSNLRLDPDWPSIIQICDLIRQNDCAPRYAITAIKKKLSSPNPHQAMFALLVLESIVKNCGSGIHDEIAVKANCEMFREFIKTTPHENVRTKMLELIQAWAFAFRNKPKYRAVQDTVNIMKTEGYKFPPLKESDAMFSADTAPDWSDGDVCHRCRVAFTLMQRKHHCRACGQVFCQQCSAKTTTLPKFGIEKEVRVCDACFDLVNRPPGPQKATDSAEAAEFGSTSTSGEKSQNPPRKTAEELQEEEELQLALALSQSEAEQKEKDRKRIQSNAPVRASTPPTPPMSVSSAPPPQAAELSRYLDRDYWERRASSTAATSNTATAAGTEASAIIRVSSPTVKMTNVGVPTQIVSNNVAIKLGALHLDENFADAELEEFVAALKSQVEIFVNRMKSNSSRGRSIANDTSVQTLFMNITAMHSRLLRYIQQQDDARVHFEGLQDKLSQVRDSRAALDVLREEHAERLRRVAEAAERQRQMQMAHKLDVMRKKKHEYLQYQRQLALQRIQEQEHELQMRQEQQKQQYMMIANAPYFPQNSPVHQYHPAQPGYANSQFVGQQFPSQQMIAPPSTTADGSMGPPNMPGGQQSQGSITGLHGPLMNQQLGQQGISIGPQGPIATMGPSGMMIGPNVQGTIPRVLASQTGPIAQSLQGPQIGQHGAQQMIGQIPSGTLRQPGPQIMQGQPVNQQAHMNQANIAMNVQMRQHHQANLQMPQHGQQMPPQQIPQQQHLPQQQIPHQQIQSQQPISMQYVSQQQHKLPQQQHMPQQQQISQQQQQQIPQQQQQQVAQQQQQQIPQQQQQQNPQQQLPQQQLPQPQQQLPQQQHIAHQQQIPQQQQVHHSQQITLPQQIPHQQIAHAPPQQMPHPVQQQLPQPNQQNVVQQPISQPQQNIGSQTPASQNVGSIPGQAPALPHPNHHVEVMPNSGSQVPAQLSPPKDTTAELISFD